MGFQCDGELIAYRLGHADYPILDGGGAFKFGSRWCSPGRYVIHAASAYALALLENVVHWRVAALPPRMQFVRVKIPAATSRAALEPRDLPGWDAYPYGPSRAYGDAWFDRMDSAVLVVPSVVSPFEPNVLINQKHPEFGSISASDPAPAVLDPRLFAAG
jgi:RES domain-containing protein